MKRFLCLLLSAAMVFSLTACQQEKAALQQKPEDTAMTTDPRAAQDLQKLALTVAALPELPKQPSAEELDKKLERAGNNHEAQQAVWDEWDAENRAYSNALRSLRGEGVNETFTDGFLAYTKDTALQLFKVRSGENVVYSPADLYLALTMLAETTDGESRAQLLKLLGLDSVEDARACADSLWRNLYQETDTGKTLLANSLWSNEQYEMKQDALKHLSSGHHASVYRAPMGEEETNRAIAEWVNENTGNLLKDAAHFDTTPETLFILLSTLCFKDQWSDEFYEGATKKDTFTNAQGKAESVDFMHLVQDHAEFFRGEGYTVAQLYFRSGASMRFLLPDEGVSLESLIESGAAVGGLQVYDMGVERGMAKLNWSVPKFDVSSDLSLIDDLKALGLSDVFDDAKADFSPLLDTDTPAAVTKVQHAARVKVDENGCEAAAFTALSVEATAAMPEDLPVIEMNLNRPFSFMITGTDGLPLFIGTVNSAA